MLQDPEMNHEDAPDAPDSPLDPILDGRHKVLFVHGAALNGGMWHTAIGQFSPDYRCLAPDLPGHGAGRQGPFVLERAVDELERSVAGLNSLSIVGESLGGYTAMVLAARLGSRVRSLVVSGASSNFGGMAYAPWFLQSAASRALEAIMGPVRFEQAVKAKVQRSVPAPLAAAVLEGKLQLQAFHEAVAELRRHDFKPDVARIHAPILFVNGSRDRRQCWQEPAFRAVALQAESHRVPGAVHGVGLWQAERFADIARKFIDRHCLISNPQIYSEEMP